MAKGQEKPKEKKKPKSDKNKDKGNLPPHLQRAAQGNMGGKK